MITLRMYAQHKGLDFGKIQVEADFFTNQEGQEWIERRVQTEAVLDAELQQKVLNICKKPLSPKPCYAVWKFVLNLVKHRLNPSLINSPLRTVFFIMLSKIEDIQSLINIGNKTK